MYEYASSKRRSPTSHKLEWPQQQQAPLTGSFVFPFASRCVFEFKFALAKELIICKAAALRQPLASAGLINFGRFWCRLRLNKAGQPEKPGQF